MRYGSYATRPGGRRGLEATSRWPREGLEEEAGRAAKLAAVPIGRGTVLRQASSARRAGEAAGGAGGAASAGGAGLGEGRPLTPAERASFDPAFGRDFSHVRVHADAAAAGLADDASAKAFTTGRHIVFGPGRLRPDTPEGAALIAHELMHVVQQDAGSGDEGGVTQLDAKDRPKGIGATPPEEPVILAKGVAPEDAFVLFDLDRADASASVTKLQKIFAAYSTPVTVELHGYASREGDDDYNSNLSGHRAVAVKKEILALLPAGSDVVLYARGETQAFGAAASNRRVGIKVIPGVKPAQPKGPPKEGEAKGEQQGKPVEPAPGEVEKGGPGFTCRPLPRIPPLVPPPGLVPPLGTPLLPPLEPPALLDWYSLRAPFTSRGLNLSERDASTIEQNWWRTYNLLRGLGLRPDLAAMGANKGTAFAYDNMLSRESPNTVDLFDRDWEKTRSILYPGEKEFRTPIVPLLTPETLEWVTKKVFNKDLKFTF